MGKIRTAGQLALPDAPGLELSANPDKHHDCRNDPCQFHGKSAASESIPARTDTAGWKALLPFMPRSTNSSHLKAPRRLKPSRVTSLFDYFIVHGSTSNRSETPRKVVIARMFSGRDQKEDIYQFSENLVLRGWNYHTTSATARKAVLRPAKNTGEPAATENAQKS